MQTEPSESALERQGHQLNLNYHSFGKSPLGLQEPLKQRLNDQLIEGRQGLRHSKEAGPVVGKQRSEMNRYNSVHTFEYLPTEPYQGFSNQQDTQKKLWIDRSQSRGQIEQPKQQQKIAQNVTSVYGLKQNRIPQDLGTSRGHHFISQNAPFHGRDFVNIASKSQLENRINRVKNSLGGQIF